MCGWTQGPNPTINWFREQPSSNSLAGILGALTDHTYGNASGFYITSRLQLPVTITDDIVLSSIVSPRLPDNVAGPMCAEWWYLMHGTEETEFSAYLIPNENYTSVKPFWRRYGDHGRHWQYAQMQIEPGNKITRVFYEVISIRSITSEVSVDDIKLLDGPCIRPDFYSISCTFEDDHICGYSSDPTGHVAWTRGRGSTPSAFTGASEGNKTFFSI